VGVNIDHPVALHRDVVEPGGTPKRQTIDLLENVIVNAGVKSGHAAV
jgi:hypothetical protein